MLTAGAIFHEASDQTVFGIGANDERWHFVLTKFAESLKPSLSANQVIKRPVPALP